MASGPEPEDSLPPSPPPDNEQPQHRPGYKRIRVKVKRRRKRNPFPRFLKIAIPICVAILLSIPLGEFFGWWRPTPVAVPAVVIPPAAPLVPESSLKTPTELVLVEAAMKGDGPARHMAGIIENTSSALYTEVQVSFTLRSRRRTVIGTAVAHIDSIAPKARVSFATDPLPAEALFFTLRDLAGTRNR